MNLFHGALADSLWLPSPWCCGALRCSPSLLQAAPRKEHRQLVFFRAVQGLSTGAGICGVTRCDPRHVPASASPAGDEPGHHLLRVSTPPWQPIVGVAVLYTPAGTVFSGSWHWWGHSVDHHFRLLPGNPAPKPPPALQRAAFDARVLGAGLQPQVPLAGTGQWVPFNGMFLYVLSAPAFWANI